MVLNFWRLISNSVSLSLRLGDRLFEVVTGLAVLYVGCVDAVRVRLEAARVVTGISE